MLNSGNKEVSCNYWDKREQIGTPNGDFFDVDYKYSVLVLFLAPILILIMIIIAIMMEVIC